MKKMRIIPQIGILVAIGIFVISCKDSNSKSSETKTVAIAFKNDLADKAFQHYTHIKTALTNGNVSEAKKGGKMLSETISNNYIDISNLSKKIAGSEDLEEQRQAFSELTNAIQPFIESNLENGEIIWRTHVGGMMLESVPALYGNKVFALLKNGYLYAIE